MRIFKLFIVFFFLLLTLPLKSHASENFATSYEVTYTVSENGSTHASYDISLTNKDSQYYVASYKVNVGFSRIENVTAKDGSGSIAPEVNKSATGYTVGVVFNDEVVGINNTLFFNISFDTPDVVQKQGSIWEVNIPGVFDQNAFTSFNVHVRVPQKLGTPTFVKPESAGLKLDFSKEQLGKSGISLGFGDKQSYAFSLDYHLKNENLFPIRTEIALPPQTNYQDVSIEDISPPPLDVTVDSDGNWLAQYSLLPSKKIDVTVSGKVKLYLYPKKEPLSEIQLSKYLKQRKYWETTDEMKKLAKELKTPRAIYNYVVNKLTYDFSRVTSSKGRVGAKGVFDDPSSAVCLEFTDLFVALSRAAGIPARELNGFAYTQNTRQRPLALVQDILHAWPEYYDYNRQTWIMVDPTWGNTTGGVNYFDTLDFDHFTFVIKGEQSDYPIPAGGYKLPGDEEKKDVSVAFTKDFSFEAAEVDLLVDLPKTVIAGFPVKGSVTVFNKSKTPYPSDMVVVRNDKLMPKENKKAVTLIPPYGKREIPVLFEKTPILTNTTIIATIRFSDSLIPQQIRILPVYLTVWGLGGGVVILGTTITILSIIARKTRRIPILRQEGQASVRGQGKKP